jgi:iron complex transport system substrate-binding protein
VAPTAPGIKKDWLYAQVSNKLLLLATLTLFSIAGCGNPASRKSVDTSSVGSEASCRSIQHRSGVTRICEQAQRVVALDPHALDLLLTLGIQPVGYAEDKRALVGSPKSGEPTVQVKYLGDRLTRPPIHVGTWQTPSLEAILKLKPDLILGRIEPSLYLPLAKIAPTLPLEPSSQERWQDGLLKLGKAMNREAQAQREIEQHQQRMAIARDKLKPITQTSKLLLLAVSATNQIEIFTDTTYAGGLLKDLGFQLVIPRPTNSGEINISLEALPQINADTIIVMASGNSNVEQVQKEWRNNPILQSLPASQAKRVHFVDYQLWSRIEGPIAAELILKQVQELLLPAKALLPKVETES